MADVLYTDNTSCRRHSHTTTTASAVTTSTRALRECKPPPTPKFETKVIRDSNLDFRINPDPDFQINPDPDVSRIFPKMLCHFTKYRTNRPLIVREIRTNVQMVKKIKK